MSVDKFTINEAQIDWEYPRKFKFTTGFGATKAESAIANYAALLAPVVMYFVSWKSLGWSTTQLVVAS